MDLLVLWTPASCLSWFPPAAGVGWCEASVGNLMLTEDGAMGFAIGSRELGGALPRTLPGARPLDLAKGPLALWTPASRLSWFPPAFVAPACCFVLHP